MLEDDALDRIHLVVRRGFAAVEWNASASMEEEPVTAAAPNLSTVTRRSAANATSTTTRLRGREVLGPSVITPGPGRGESVGTNPCRSSAAARRWGSLQCEQSTWAGVAR